MLYFAFGSNLDPDQMKVRCPGHRVVGMAALRDHKLVFPIFSNSWNGGVASLQLSHGNDVWGVVYDLTEDDLRSLDGYEGYHGPGAQNLYEREPLWVELVRPEDGSVPRRVKAFAYLARVAANPSPPSPAYMDAVIKGAIAHGLSDEYVAALRRIPTLSDAPSAEPEKPEG
jgi:hypothetical protein